MLAHLVQNRRMAHPIDVEIGIKIRTERLSAGLTQKELAAQIGVKFQQLQKYESAANRVAGSRLWMIAKALSVPVDSLLPADPEAPNLETPRQPGDALLMSAILRLEPELKREVVRFVHAISNKKSDSMDH